MTCGVGALGEILDLAVDDAFLYVAARPEFGEGTRRARLLRLPK